MKELEITFSNLLKDLKDVINSLLVSNAFVIDAKLSSKYEKYRPTIISNDFFIEVDENVIENELNDLELGEIMTKIHSSEDAFSISSSHTVNRIEKVNEIEIETLNVDSTLNEKISALTEEIEF